MRSSLDRIARRAAGCALLGLCLLAACSAPPTTGDRRVAAAPTRPRLHVVMIDGGGSPAQNYQSHLLHVRQLLDLLLRTGVPRERITIFSADGADPAADLAMRDADPEGDFWLLRGTRLERMLRPIHYTNSSVEGMTLEPATRAALARWFDGAATRLAPGDTLLLYVTDHGAKNADDVRDNRITLWGRDEALSVSELRAHLARLPRGVRVVALMSQCYSGAFAHLMDAQAPDGLPSGAVCGYFSSTAERPAYGCYPENRGVANIGHSFDFLQALAASGRATDAHAQVLVTDQTPDVPLRASDVFADDTLRRVATERSEEPAPLADELLREAWHDRAAWEPEIRLLDRIGHAFGCFSPRSLAEVDEQAKRLPAVNEQLGAYSKAWKAALGDALEANVGRFTAAHPEWAERLKEDGTAQLDVLSGRDVSQALLVELVPFTRADRKGGPRLRMLKAKSDAAAAAAYRMEVRLAAVLRLRTVLTSIAGRVYFATRAPPAERGAYDALRACEDFVLPGPPPGSTLTTAEPFPPFEEDARRAAEVLPAWMGINFREAPAAVRKAHALGAGAAAVMTVYPGSPAESAGLQVGDIVLGPPGKPFTEPGQIRSWTMLSPIGQPRRLDVLRGDQRLEVTLVSRPFPVKFPDLPGPPRPNSPAPPLVLGSYRGTPPAALAGNGPHLLFFWATWCAPCKAALPEVLAFERARATPVIAITDEDPERLDGFFAAFGKPFPSMVAVDPYRRTHQAYGVSGTPTFVLVDGDGIVRAYSTGYAADKGLGVEGWTWADRH